MKKIILFVLIIFIVSSSTVFLGCNKKTPLQSTLKEIYLTFDDGPSKVTEDILSVLEQSNVKATFFVVGKCVEKNPQIIKRIYNSGHSIGIHSYSHEYKKIYFEKYSLIQDINLCNTAIKKIIPDFNTKLYRFPGGSFNLSEETKNIPLSLNLKYYDWNASICDAEGVFYSPEELVYNAINTSYKRKKIILLCHDCAGKTNTALALPSIISYFKNEGYLFKTL